MLVPSRSNDTDVLGLFEKLDPGMHSSLNRKNSQVARFSVVKSCEGNIGREKEWSKTNSYTV